MTPGFEIVPSFKEYHKKMCDLQNEAFLRQAVEQVLEEVKARFVGCCPVCICAATCCDLTKAECPPPNALPRD